MNSVYASMTDNDILRIISENGDSEAVEFMMKKYSSLVKKEIRAMFIVGAETEDLAQEAMIGLFKAIRDFHPEKGAAFITFATLCVRRQIRTAITASNGQKHIPLNTYISIYADEDENGNASASEFEDEKAESDPEKMILAKERQSQMAERIRTELSPLEYKVLRLYLEGLPYSDISIKLGKSEKAVGNALQRIRAKLSSRELS